MVAVIDQCLTDNFALYNGDSIEVLQGFPAESIHHSIYSPPFAVEEGRNCLYSYSSSERDLSNCRSYGEFFEHYEYVVKEIARITMPGRISAVHCMDVPKDGANICGYADFPGDIIKLHQKHGFEYLPRKIIWKEPLAVRNRLMTKALAHRQICDDSAMTNVAAADYLIPFRKKGKNPIPVAHPVGLLEYFGADEIPADLYRFRGMEGDQKLNRFSHWIWRKYASSIWHDIRGNQGDKKKDDGSTLNYEGVREEDDERHPHPLQLDVIRRSCTLYSNPGETVLTPFMGIGSEVYGAVEQGRKGIGIELKPSYYSQACLNVPLAMKVKPEENLLF